MFDKIITSDLFRTVTNIILAVFALVMLLPFFWLVCGSLKSREDFFSSLFLPINVDESGGFQSIAWGRLTLENFTRLIQGELGEFSFLQHVMNSVFIASTTAFFGTLFCCSAAFALAKYRFSGKRFVTLLVFSALIIPAPLLIAPSFKLLYDLNLLDTYSGLIVPCLTPSFGIFLFRQTMINSIPDSLIEAARIDGASDIKIFVFVVIPLVRPMIGTYIVVSFLHAWNNFIGPQIILNSPEKHPLSVAISQLQGLYYADFGMISAGTLISIAPIMCLFLIMQKEYVSGLTSGATKG